MMITGMMLFGCEAPEQPAEKTTSPATPAVKMEDKTAVESNEIVIPAVIAAKAAADKSQERAEQMDKIAESATEDTAEAITTAAQEAVETVKETTAPIVEQTAAVVAETKELAAPVVTASKELGPEEITLSASYGNISFPHSMHAESYACTTCHGTETPAAFGLTKEVAHPLCKDCHKAEGAGPTGCRDCHVK